MCLGAKYLVLDPVMDPVRKFQAETCLHVSVLILRGAHKYILQKHRLGIGLTISLLTAPQVPI